ncbi:MAG TPA: methylated-DNA--[protein]-cysteine S-methyltransferase [Ferruginibacter sp.]|nr:methylated-DNA--[protein]-cysteine S-methyltransferase [Ferruginibacter sp.]
MLHSVYFQSPIGILYLTANEDFITGINFTEKKLEQQNQFSTHHPVLQNCINQLAKYFTGEHVFFHLNTLQAGTTFQQKVWEELCRIKPGQTISYLELSKRLGNTKAIRAAGTANGKNNIAIVVPCHRVIGSNSKLVGYAGGLWRKKWLLNHEAKYCNGQQELF